ncbi:hypothetical protein K456DRAFT_1179635 [Colletotrichum gloeosporioides 23]|nr:hypothetical protein K456DRAFT_1179635 [Colletotrichum gloeosporioides 23]
MKLPPSDAGPRPTRLRGARRMNLSHRNDHQSDGMPGAWLFSLYSISPGAHDWGTGANNIHSLPSPSANDGRMEAAILGCTSTFPVIDSYAWVFHGHPTEGQGEEYVMRLAARPVCEQPVVLLLGVCCNTKAPFASVPSLLLVTQ